MATLKMAVVGAGIWGETHAGIIREHPGAELAAVCDRDIAKARAVAAKYGAQEVYGSVEEMLARSDADAVSIATPDHLHADVAVACANARRIC